jgi:DNA-binding IclR family transcriptional regulator
MNSKFPESSTLFVASVAKAFRLLEAFGSGRAGLKHADMSSLTGLDKSAAQRFAYTLEALGYLRKDPDSRAYSLTPKALALGLNYLRANGVAEPAAPFLREAARQSDETVNLTQLHGNEIVYIGRIPSRHIISTDVLVGTRYPAWCTATGRVMLAHLPDLEMQQIVRESNRVAYTKHTITEFDQLVSVIRRVREDGYTFCTDQIFHGGEYTVAAPVFGPAHEPIAAVGITGLASRHEQQDFITKMVPIVIDTAAAISATQGRRHRLPQKLP